MKRRDPLSQILVGSLLIVGLSSPQMRVLADEPLTATVPVVAPTPTATPTAKNVEVQLPEPSGEVNLLKIFPVQEPWKKSDENANAPDEATIAAKAQAGEVWVNARSGVFQQAGTAHYGKTKAGFFLPETEAVAKGYRGVKE